MRTVTNEIVMNSGAPRIAGTRVAVYDVIAHLRVGDSAQAIADWYDLSLSQVESAIEYIEQHRAEVEAVYDRILARNAKGDPPDLREKTKLSAGKAAALRDKLRQNGALRAD